MANRNEPTAAQQSAVAELREAFGRHNVKERYVLKHNGMLWVDLYCQLGTWRFSYDPNGELRHSSLDMTLELEGLDVAATRSGAPTRNAQDDNDT